MSSAIFKDQYEIEEKSYKESHETSFQSKEDEDTWMMLVSSIISFIFVFICSEFVFFYDKQKKNKGTMIR